jgi:hypothetical protein
MMSDRASVFESDVDFDVSEFAPRKKRTPPNEAPREEIRAVSEALNFRSREPVPTTQEEPLKREPRRYRTGRNVQLNIKVRAESLESFYELADKEGWVLGETLERAITALKKELAAKRVTA